MYLAIIPARSGSKRIKNKNIKLFFGLPVIKYSIDAALSTKLFKEIIVSTDSKKIRKIAIKHGASVPFLRDNNLADDSTPIKNVLLHTLKKIKKNILPDYFCLIYATAPLIDKKDIVRSLHILRKIKNKSDGICSVCKYKLPIQRALKINKKNFLEFIEKRYALTRSQDLHEAYYDAGTFAWYNTKNFLNKNALNLKILPYVLSSTKVQDIDDIEDWNLAKKKFLKK